MPDCFLNLLFLPCGRSSPGGVGLLPPPLTVPVLQPPLLLVLTLLRLPMLLLLLLLRRAAADAAETAAIATATAGTALRSSGGTGWPRWLTLHAPGGGFRGENFVLQLGAESPPQFFTVGAEYSPPRFDPQSPSSNHLFHTFAIGFHQNCHVPPSVVNPVVVSPQFSRFFRITSSAICLCSP